MFAFFAGLAAGLLHVFSGPDHLAAVAPLAADGDRSGGARDCSGALATPPACLLIATLLLLLKEQLPLDADLRLQRTHRRRLADRDWILGAAWRVAAQARGAAIARPFARGRVVRDGHGSWARRQLAPVWLSAGAGVCRARRFDPVTSPASGVGAIAGMSAFAAGMGLLATRLGGHHQRRYSGVALRLFSGRAGDRRFLAGRTLKQPSRHSGCVRGDAGGLLARRSHRPGDSRGAGPDRRQSASRVFRSRSCSDCCCATPCRCRHRSRRA